MDGGINRRCIPGRRGERPLPCAHFDRKTEEKGMKEEKKPAVSRRKFLTGAAAAGAGAATLGFPAVVKAQGPVSMRWQSTWPTKDIFHEYAVDFATKVNDMSGGDLKIEVLPAGAVVKAF